MVRALDSRSLIGSGTSFAGMTRGPPHSVIPAKPVLAMAGAGIQNLQPNLVFLYDQIKFLTQTASVKLLPETTIIDPKKLCDYLLNRSHPEGATKAQYLAEMGCNQENYQILDVDLRNQHLTQDAQLGKVPIYGTKYETVAPLDGPNGKQRLIRSVWMIRKGDTIARLITLIAEKKL